MFESRPGLAEILALGPVMPEIRLPARPTLIGRRTSRRSPGRCLEVDQVTYVQARGRDSVPKTGSPEAEYAWAKTSALGRGGIRR